MTTQQGERGWPFVESDMMFTIAMGGISHEQWSNTIEGYRESWAHYQEWKLQNPGATPPPWIARIRSPLVFAAWVADGMKEYATWSDEADAVVRP